MIGKVELLRLEQGDNGTLGVLRVDGRVACVTLETPDRGNRTNVSCIPTGRYDCRGVDSPRFGQTYEVMDVPGRSHILFHPGNVVSDTRGCILLGRGFGVLRGDRAVLNSGRTFAEFMQQCDGNESFPLVVENLYEEDSWKTFA